MPASPPDPASSQALRGPSRQREDASVNYSEEPIIPQIPDKFPEEFRELANEVFSHAALASLRQEIRAEEVIGTLIEQMRALVAPITSSYELTAFRLEGMAAKLDSFSARLDRIQEMLRERK